MKQARILGINIVKQVKERNKEQCFENQKSIIHVVDQQFLIGTEKKTAYREEVLKSVIENEGSTKNIIFINSD